VGKTAIARVLAGLWAVEDGKIIRPERGFNGVFVVPQRAYMVTGSLLDQSASLHYAGIGSELTPRVELFIPTPTPSSKSQERRNKTS
jgi:hypothetical protein